ncbi:DUF4149 domain-containing protein [Jannaschia ovalis]|uniref:DUF4149 domain-containing protein n=1 Tax=Jannaschia ovalis TaxID=3038773 RepID=A0ABY8LE99_9RHOB|nr:DUF4149 domain-containing protein [Jannaschia sp. GRR-S6-38]WGH79644.1 DUF4149 domain-containing protein [Jannaschia sp. GRR-S6-38]
MAEIALLGTALLFGGMVLYAFGFAAFIFSALPADAAGPVIRRAFPHFYLFVLAAAVLAGVFATPVDRPSALVLAAVAASTVLARQVLMPAVNAATDAGNARRFKALHGLSVLLTLAHIGAAGVVILRLAGA